MSSEARREARWATVLGLALGAWWFGSAAAGVRMLFTRDIEIFWYGHVEFLLRSLAAGEFPLWNPYRHFGQPTVPYAVGQIFYPTTLPQALLPPPMAYGWFALFHFMAAFLGAWALVRRLGASPPAAATTAALWACGGPLLSTVHMANTYAAAAWMPWAFLAADRLRDADDLRPALGLGGCLALAVLAGSPELAAMGATGLVAGAGAPAGRGRYLRHVAVAVAFGVALSAVQWLPTLEHLPRSARTAMPAEASVFWSNHPRALAQALAPIDIASLPLTGEARRELFSGRDPFLHSIYLGLAASGFVALGLLTAPRRVALGFGLVGATALALSLGRHSPLYLVLAPLLAPFRFPSKLTLLATLCWAVLAGFGVNALATADRRRRAVAVAVALITATAALQFARPDAALWASLAPASELAHSEIFERGVGATRIAAGLAGLAALLLASGSRRAAWWAAALAATDLCLALAALNPTVDAQLYPRRAPAMALLPAQRPNRTLVLSYPTPDIVRLAIGRGTALPRPFGLPPLAEFAAWRLYPHTSLGSGLWGLEGSPQDVASLGLLDSRRFDWFTQSAAASPDFQRLVEVSGTSFVLALHGRGLEGLPLLQRLPGPAGETIGVHAVPGALPRAYAVSGVRSHGPYARQTWELIAPDFVPSTEAYVDGEAARPPLPDFRATVSITHLGFTRVELAADLAADGFVVLLESFDPHWRASVDGATAPVRRANVAFRAVPVPAGRHAIVLSYRPWPVAVGAAVSVLALLGLGVFLWRSAQPGGSSSSTAARA